MTKKILTMLNIDEKIKIKESLVIDIDDKIEGVSIEVVIFVSPITIIISKAEIDEIFGFFCRANSFTFTDVICTWQ